MGARAIEGPARAWSPFGNSLALFLDFDGTVVDIAAHPRAVEVDPDLAGVLASLRRRLDGSLALVSGRSIAAVDEFFRPEVFDVAGLHGAEWRCQGEIHRPAAGRADRLSRVLPLIERSVALWPGVIIEHKGGAIAVHFRLAPERECDVRRLVEEALTRLGGGFRLQSGRAVHEIVPAEADKGAAVSRFLATSRYRGRLPVFAGDDATDERAFQIVDALGGLAIRVGLDGLSHARVRMADPVQVRQWLAEWARTGRIPLGPKGSIPA